MRSNFCVPLAAAAVIFSAASFNVAAQSAAQGNWTEPAGGNIVWRSSAGECWRAGYWSRDIAVAECDPDLVKKPMPAARAAPEPAPAAPPPAPAPQPVAAPVPPPQKVTLKGDALFGFDQAVIKPGTQAVLDDLASKAMAMDLEVIIAIGHTDPIGASAYNQKLSVRRANAVKNYLISKGVDPDRVYTEGKGASQQVKACNPKMKFKERVACLEPNRRVELEVIGTRR